MIPVIKYVKVISSKAQKIKTTEVPVESNVNNTDILITSNGIYEPEPPYTGFGSVTARVAIGWIPRKLVNGELLLGGGVPDLTGVEKIGTYALEQIYSGVPSAERPSGNVTFLSGVQDFSGAYACNRLFSDCSNITSVDLSGLINISGQNAAILMFYFCTGLELVKIENLRRIDGDSACVSMFSACSSLKTVSFDSLESIGRYACQYMFENSGIESLYFPALKSTEFAYNNSQFSGMLYGVEGCVVHFPSNLQAVIGSWGDVVNGFSGTNTTVLFDLPATE